nr:immunoglobulin light chain junction region [Macaca mulatta]
HYYCAIGHTSGDYIF